VSVVERIFGLEIPISLAEVCHPRRTALVVYDMQAGIVSQVPEASAIVDRIREILDVARLAGYRVFFTRHMSLPTEVAGVTQLRTAMAWQRVSHVAQVRPAFPRNSSQFQIVPDLTPRPEEAIFDKITMSAFEGTPLDIALRDCGINSFVIVGIALEIGIEPTVRHATDLGYIPIVVTDACGHGNAAAAERSLASLAFAGGSLQTDSATLVRLMTARGGELANLAARSDSTAGP
jgi:nicotinamidase-related amidase